MNFSKKILSCLLAMSMALPVAAFSDVDNNNYVDTLAEKGIIKGYNEGTFGGDDICTRGQFLTFLWRASGEPEAKKFEQIKDITGEEYYANAVWWAFEKGITKIYSDDCFNAQLPVDREHAAYYLYNWSKLYGKSDVTKTMYMDKYTEDGVNISPDSRIPFSWAMANGILEECENSLVKPQNPVNRLWTAIAIGRLLENHVCQWTDWADNADGTHSRVCTLDAAHKETEEHSWNDGELTTPPTQTEKGLVTYTCTGCKISKTEEAPAGTKFTTRADAEEAIVNTAFAYYVKGPKVQYDSTHLTDISAYFGNIVRLTAQTPPEASTKDKTFYTVCSDFTHQTFYEAFGKMDMGKSTIPFGLDTGALFRHADNQANQPLASNKIIDPQDEEDVDACIFRWVHFDEYLPYKKASFVTNNLVSSGVFESSSFTDFTTGLTFKDDGYEGEVHYSYYDQDGNKLDYREAREKYLDPFSTDFEKNFRPGDLIVNHSHAMLYVGNNRIIDATTRGGGKIDTATGIDKIEPAGSVIADRLFTDTVTKETTKSLVAIRPLEFYVKEGYDGNPGNDIIKDFEIPEKTLSRIKYPAMDIDRTVDITGYGTAVNGGNLTYTVEIFNKTNDENYKAWLGENALKTYENLAVTEKIPENCELVEESITNGGKYENGVISWNIAKIAPGESAVLSYTVKVKGETGSAVVSGGGMVDNIPSNTIKNTIGGEKLSETEKTALSNISLQGVDGLKALGDDTAFANAIYKAMGKELNLPTTGDIVKELFPVSPVFLEHGLSIFGPGPFDGFAYTNSGTETELKKMIVNTFWGGWKFYVGDDLRYDYAGNAIKETKKDYLEAGDIIIYAASNDKENLSYNFDLACVMVYDGKNLLSSRKTVEGTTYEIFDEETVEAELTKLFQKEKDLFFALRPSQSK